MANRDVLWRSVIIHDKVRKTGKIRKRYNQVPHLTQDTTWESNKKNTINITIKTTFTNTGFKPSKICSRNQFKIWLCPGPEVIKLFSCSTQLSTKFTKLINVKMPTIVGILTFISMIKTTSERPTARHSFIRLYFCFYEQLKFPAQLG